MVFSSYLFIFIFLPLALLIYYASPGKWKHLSLTIMSYIFYGWANPSFVFLMFFTSTVDYTNGRLMTSYPLRKRLFLTLSIVTNLTVLGFFKYFVFAQNNLNALVVWFGGTPFPVLQVVLPVGISFFVFQSLSYSIDVYRGESPPVRSLADFACFVALFPQLSMWLPALLRS